MHMTEAGTRVGSVQIQIDPSPLWLIEQTLISPSSSLNPMNKPTQINSAVNCNSQFMPTL